MKVAEIFESYQGEGPEVGMRAVFVRLHGCNLKCARCDTKYSWEDDNVYEEVSLGDVEDMVYGYGVPNVIITGGEPLMQKRAVELLVQRLRSSGQVQYVGLETNGTVKRFKKELFSRVVVSPKRFPDLEWWMRKLNKSGWKTRLVLKIVADGRKWGIGRYPMDTLLEYRDVLDQPHVYFMPEGYTSTDVVKNARELCEWLTHNGFTQARISPRMHVTMGWR